jgi:hypothetical protein
MVVSVLSGIAITIPPDRNPGIRLEALNQSAKPDCLDPQKRAAVVMVLRAGKNGLGGGADNKSTGDIGDIFRNDFQQFLKAGG